LAGWLHAARRHIAEMVRQLNIECSHWPRAAEAISRLKMPPEAEAPASTPRHFFVRLITDRAAAAITPRQPVRAAVATLVCQMPIFQSYASFRRRDEGDWFSAASNTCRFRQLPPASHATAAVDARQGHRLLVIGCQ